MALVTLQAVSPTGAYRKRPRRRVANGGGFVFPDNRKPLVYRKYICQARKVLAKGKEGSKVIS